MGSLNEKLLDIQAKLKVGKTRYNGFAEFNYRSCEDILLAVKPMLTERGLIILFNDEIVEVCGRVYVGATVTISDGENSMSVKAYAREPEKPKSKMDESQATGSTSSYARKYALNGLFALDDGNDSDQLNNGKEPESEKLITKEQIEQLKKLGFNDERFAKMADYYKVKKLEDVTYKQAAEAIRKQTKAVSGNGKG